MTHPREPELADAEAARLLREIANKPQAAVIFPLHHGRWSGNVVEALLRGAERLDPQPPKEGNRWNRAST